MSLAPQAKFSTYGIDPLKVLPSISFKSGHFFCHLLSLNFSLDLFWIAILILVVKISSLIYFLGPLLVSNVTLIYDRLPH
jgi:hypothetical protein